MVTESSFRHPWYSMCPNIIATSRGILLFTWSSNPALRIARPQLTKKTHFRSSVLYSTMESTPRSSIGVNERGSLTELTSICTGLDEDLGFHMDTWHSNVLGGTEFSTKTVYQNISRDTVEELTLYCRMKGWKVHVTHTPFYLFLKIPLIPHECIGHFISAILGVFNVNRTGNVGFPLAFRGSAKVPFNVGHSFEPDGQWGVPSRTGIAHASPNFTLEVHYRHDESLVNYLTRLRHEIERTDGVMLVLGIKVYHLLPNGPNGELTFRAVGVLYERVINNGMHTHEAQVTHLVSFGNQQLTHMAVDAWEDQLVAGLMTGDISGVDGAPVNAPGQCMLPIRADYLICMDHCGNLLPANLVLYPGETVNLDLFQIQQSLLSGFIDAFNTGALGANTALPGWVGDN